ncbi:LysM peptidoglycan-binding domain-containing protein, partial [Chromobacterium sp. IRSSSOUMB001]|uniref:LysM peptidoglycan-binding domain-containing protein n=1 Tax=Chromobacterium sp. IRSSSOUMB001 TaxID=2927123 RepID=UPI0020BE675F
RLQKTVVPSQTVIYGDVRKDGAPTVRVQDLVTERQYDANGNVVCEIDPRGNRTLRWYDLAGRKLLEVDAAGYAVAWSYSTAGKPVREVRYAAAVTVPVDGIALDEARGLLKPGAQDRISEFDYDRMGRLLEERRLNVDYYEQASLEASKKPEEDAIAQIRQTGSVRTLYRYNALGLLTQKTDAKGAVTDIRYDALGRETHREEAAFIDQAGQSVRPTTDTSYNDLSLTTKVVKAGVDGVFSETQYSLGGRADWMRDAEGNITFYDYDAVGNVTRTRRERKEAAGGQDVTLYAYNAAKLQTAKQDVATGVWQEVSYNAWGQITGKRTSINRQGDWQEFSEYDTAGRLIRGNAGGVTKLYGYDANGNSTLTVVSGRSQGDELRALTLEQVLYRLSQVNGSSFQDDLEAFRLSVSDYDARNLHVATRQPKIVNKHQDSVVQVEAWTTAEQQTGRGDVVTTDGAFFRDTVPMVSPMRKADIAIVGDGLITSQILFNGFHDYLLDARFGRGEFGRAFKAAMTFNFPENVLMLGDGRYKFDIVSIVRPMPKERFVETKYGYSGGSVNVDVNLPLINFEQRNYKFEVSIYKEVQGQEVFLGKVEKSFNGMDVIGRYLPEPLSFPKLSIARSEINFKNQIGVSKVIFLTRRVPSESGWVVQSIPNMKINGHEQSSWFSFDWSKMERGKYEFCYLSLDGQGKLLNARQGEMNLDDKSPNISQNNLPMNSAFMTVGAGGEGLGSVNVVGISERTNRTLIRFRANGGAWGEWVERGGVSSDYSGAWFQFNLADYGLKTGVSYEYDLEYFSGQQSLGRLIGSLQPGNSNSVTAPVRWHEQPQIVHIKNQLPEAVHGVVRFRPVGSQLDFKEVVLVKSEGREFNWDCVELARSLLLPTLYEFEYQLFDVVGRMVNRAQGSIALGGGAVTLDKGSVVGLALPMYVAFYPEQAAANKMELQYREKSGGAWQEVKLNRKENGPFALNVDALVAGDYEYRYQLKDINGVYLQDSDGSTLLVNGFMRRGVNGEEVSTGRLRWVLLGVTNREATITRRQTYNAFGEVISETDGAGNTIRSEYNAAGKLVAKREAALKLRDDNGDVLKNVDGSDKLTDEAVTRYGYDALGNLVSSIDANGHENRQRWLAGSQEGQGKVLRERHADGSSKEMAYDRLGNLRIVTVNGQRQQDYQYDKLGRLKRMDRAQRADGSRGYDEYDYDSAGQRIAHRTSDGKAVSVETTRYDSLGRVLEAVSAASRHTTYSYAWDAQLKGAGGIVVGGWRTTTTNANNMTMQDAVDWFGLKGEHRDLGGRVTQYQYNNAGQLIRQQSDQGQNILYTYYGNGNLQGMEDRAANRFTLYGYDDDGRKNYEAYASGPDRDHLTFYQQSVMRYDERGRVIEIKDPRFLSRYQYDAVGNRLRVYSEYQDGKDGSKQVQDNWYAYDAMNRFTVTQGSRDASGNIVEGSRGTRIEYDGFGQRAKASNGSDGTVETYSYTADGYLTDTQINGKLAYRRSNDLLGRVTDAESFSWDGQVKARKTHTDYDADNKMLRQVVDGKATKYGLMADGTLKFTQQEDDTTVTTYYEYEWWDEAKQSKITAHPYNKDAPGWRPGISHLTYDVNGHLREAIDEQGQRSLRYINDAQGVVIRREELDKQSVYKRQDYYYVDGKQVGAVGNDGPSRMDFAQALAQGQLGGKKDQYRFGVAVSSADFDQNYEPIAPNYPGQAPSTVTVRGGDTLQSLAAGLWGDKSLWYLLADANGLSGNETLAAGQTLRVPNKVTNVHNNSGTYRVYNPGEAIGDVTPTLPDPPPPPPQDGGGCGGIGAIFVAVVAVVAVVMTAGAAALAMAGTLSTTFAAGGLGAVMAAGGSVLAGTAIGGLSAGAMMGAAAIGGAVGSIVSQGVAMAMG